MGADILLTTADQGIGACPVGLGEERAWIWASERQVDVSPREGLKFALQFKVGL